MSDYPAEWEADVLLRDGSTCHIRPIKVSDGDLLRSFHSKLSPETIYTRFFAPYPELTDKDVERFTTLDYVNRVALVATVAGEIIGVGRYDKVGDLDAEVAFTVRDDYQGRGLGSVLLEHLAAAARERGLRRFVADVLPQNRKMAATFSRAGYRVASELQDGVLKVAFEIQSTETLRAVAAAREQRADSLSIERLLNPGSVAVVGASPRPDSLGRLMLARLMAGGFAGRLTPVHREAAQIAGLRAYPSVGEVPGSIDLAVVVVPVDQVPGVVADCGAAGVHGMLIVSSGFADSGPSGFAREQELARAVRGHGMRLVGPNSLGLINTDPHTKICAVLSNAVPPRGRTAMFCQSAAISAAALHRLASRHLGVSSFVSAGNRADVCGEDLLQYWLSENDSDLVLMYLETLVDPRKFIRIAADVSEHKPVVIVRSGRTSQAFPLGPRGRRSQLSAKAVNQLIGNAGVIEAGSLSEQVDIAGLLACQPLPSGHRVTVLGDSNDLVVLASDTAATIGMQVVDQVFIGEDCEETDIGAALLARVDSHHTDAIVVVHVPPTASDDAEVREAILAASQRATIPVVAVLQDEAGHNSLLRLSHRPGGPAEWGLEIGDQAAQRGSVPYFGTVEEAIRALDATMTYSTWLSRERGAVPEYSDVDAEGARAWIDEIQGRRMYGSEAETIALSESELRFLLDCYGIRLAEWRPVSSEDEAVAAADEVGWPVALKTMDPRMNRRGGLAGVRLNIESEPSLRAAYLSLAGGLDAYAASRIVVQPMARDGVQCVVRSREDALFGPVVSFGLGGSVAELLDDHAYQVPPITDADAGRLIRGPRAASLLFGYGGNEAVDLAALEDLVVRVGMLCHEFPQIIRLDLNPIMATPVGLSVLYAEAWMRPGTAHADSEARRLSNW